LTYLVVVFGQSRHGHSVYVGTAGGPQSVFIFIQHSPAMYKRVPREPHIFEIILMWGGTTGIVLSAMVSCQLFQAILRALCPLEVQQRDFQVGNSTNRRQ
jgi:hypothetical protein